jgi:hypothetical protein
LMATPGYRRTLAEHYRFRLRHGAAATKGVARENLTDTDEAKPPRRGPKPTCEGNALSYRGLNHSRQ